VFHLRKAQKYNELFMSANLQFSELICRPPTSGYLTVIFYNRALKDTDAVAKNSRKKLKTWERGGGTVISERGLCD
jgi:hypothetical protein